MTCGTDFLSRVGGDIATRGRMQRDGGTGPAPQASPMDRAIASLAPDNFSEDDIEQLVQVITDQIMATV